MSRDRLGPWVCTRWVTLYTRRLPAEIGALRRAEIASDLWEHEHDATLDGRGRLQFTIDVIGRVLSGIPADLSWRRGIQRLRPRPDLGDPMRNDRTTSIPDLALLILAGLGIVAPLPFLALLGSFIVEGPDLTGLVWILGVFALSGILAAGLVLRLRGGHPALATTLLVIGSLSPSLSWFWLPPVYLLTIATAAVAIATTRSRPLTPTPG